MELGCVSPAGGRDVLLRTAVPAHQACAILQNHGLAVQRGSALWYTEAILLRLISKSYARAVKDKEKYKRKRGEKKRE